MHEIYRVFVPVVLDVAGEIVDRRGGGELPVVMEIAEKAAAKGRAAALSSIDFDVTAADGLSWIGSGRQPRSRIRHG